MSPPISKENKEMLQKMIIDTIAMLCRSHFEKEPYFRLDGVVGLTLSSDDVVLINMHKEVENETAVISSVRKRPLDDIEFNSDEIKRRKVKGEIEDDSDWVDLTDHDIEVKEEVEEQSFETLAESTDRLEDGLIPTEDHPQEDHRSETPLKNNWPGLAASSTTSAGFVGAVGRISGTPLSSISASSSTGTTPAGSTKQREKVRKEPSVCVECGKWFSSRAHVRRHMRKHTGETPYACSYCQSRFSRSDELKTHVVRKHPEQCCYSCSSCTQRFVSEKHLSRHKCINDQIKLPTS